MLKPHPLILSFVTVIIGGLFLSLPSLLNNFPFMFNDSGYYILHATVKISESSFLWRPLTYSLFLKSLLSLGSLLFFIVGQNILISGILYSFLGLFINQRKSFYFIFVLYIMALTPLIHYSNFIMPDIFSGIMVLCFCAMLLAKRMPVKITWFVLFNISMMMHNLNLAVGILLLAAVLLINRSRHLFKLALLMLPIPLLLIALLHFSIAGRFSLSNSTHIFLYSQFSSLGIAEEYLSEACKSKDYQLCKNKTVHFNIWDWNPDGRIGKSGGLRKLSPEIKTITYDILTSPLVFKAIFLSFRGVFPQLVQFSQPLEPTIASTSLLKELEIYSEREKKNYTRQVLNTISLDHFFFWQNLIYFSITWLSFGILCFLFFKKWLDARVRLLFLYSSMAYFANALICALLTAPAPRYSGRMVWVFPLALTLQAVITYSLRHDQRKTI